MHIKITELNTYPNCRQNLGPTRWLLGPGLRKFFFSLGANIMILLFSPETNETKRFHYIWICDKRKKEKEIHKKEKESSHQGPAESSVVVQEHEFAINRALYGFL